MGLFSRSSSDTPSERPTIDPYPSGYQDDGDGDFTITFGATASPEALQRLDNSLNRNS